ncbi:MAG: exonuclease [Bacteroidetes bacterium]|nr:MAG: exonuclease [Bacteroidota bacterium]
MKQQSAEWIQSRLGKANSSRVFDLLPGKRGGDLASRKRYLLEVMAERLTGVQQEFYVSKAMEHGVIKEPVARSAYEAITGNVVKECGSFDHPTIPKFASSPDGLTLDGGIEIKAPETITAIEYLATGVINPRYMVQMQCQMMCAGLAWVDYIVFDDRLPEQFQFNCVRVYPDFALQTTIEAEVRRFIAEADHMEAKIRA